MSVPAPDISIIVPLYNEEEIFPELVKRVTAVIESIAHPAEVILVNDGSTDSTPVQMAELALRDTRFQAVFLSRNFGHQIAISAGLKQVRAKEAVMIIDGDLQDPPELLHEFLPLLREGNDIVYAVRKTRKEGFLKRAAYNAFYKILNRLANIDMPLDSGDFCLMSRRVVDCLNSMPEESRFLRGMRSWVGFKQIPYPYDRSERAGGSPKYTYRMLLKLAFNGIFNFSEIPVRLATLTGLLVLFIGVSYGLWSILSLLILGTTPKGFTGLLMTMVLFSGTQLLFLGIIGEYILRIFFQVKQRPLFLVKERIVDGKTDNLIG